MPSLVCPIPTGISHDDARSMFAKIRKDMPGLTPAAWRREAARRMGVSYDDYLKAWKTPKTKTPTPPSPIVTPVTPRPVLPAPAPKPSPMPPAIQVNYDTTRAQFKMVKRENPSWTDAQIRHEAARRMNVDYDTYLRNWKKPATPRPSPSPVRQPATTKQATPKQETLVRPQEPTVPPWQVKVEDYGREWDVRYTNPGYRSHREFQVNCPSTTTSYELRRRGYDVVARRMPGGAPHSEIHNAWGWPPQLGSNGSWITAPYNIYTKVQTFVNEAAILPVGARGFISVAWKNGGAHIYNWEVRSVKKTRSQLRPDGSVFTEEYEAKQLWYVDAQSRQEWRHGSRPGSPESAGRDYYLSRADQNRVFIHRVDEHATPSRNSLDWLASDRKDGQLHVRNSPHVPGNVRTV